MIINKQLPDNLNNEIKIKNHENTLFIPKKPD